MLLLSKILLVSAFLVRILETWPIDGTGTSLVRNILGPWLTVPLKGGAKKSILVLCEYWNGLAVCLMVPVLMVSS